MRERLMQVGLVAAALALAAPALAAGEADPKGVWDLFTKTCRSAVEADDPARAATQSGAAQGAAAATEDGRISGATVSFDDAPGGTHNMTLQVMVNRFEGGRTVVCMLHLFQPDPALSRLFEIARDNATALSADLEHVVGGPFQPLTEPQGQGTELKDARFARISNDGFPPSAVLTVQVMPVLVGLTYFVSQPGRD